MEQPQVDEDVVVQQNSRDIVHTDIAFQMHNCCAAHIDCDCDLGTSTRHEQMVNWIMKMQSVWDEFKAPIEMQDKMIKMLFSGVFPSKGRKAMAGREKSLAMILLNNAGNKIEKPFPQNFNQLYGHYRSLGMVEPQRWRLCFGSKEISHPPRVFRPSKEENFVGDVLKCSCPSGPSTKLQRNCNVCCMRCGECGNSRNQMVPFDYISIMDQLKLLCRSSTNCHEFLAMWRARGTWLGSNSHEEQQRVKEFWHGEKVRLYQDFWNPNASWESPVICQNEKCRLIYRTFPLSMRSQELNGGWSEERQEYNFRCSKCRSSVQSKRKLVQGDPRNFALICHWDGFQAASTKQKDVGVVEMSLANANKGSEVGPLPLLFIPFSFVKLEQKHGNLLQYFLIPMVEELFSAFVNGFDVHYNYPSSLISDGLNQSMCILRAILMLWTGDHPAQCKLGMLKDGGKNGCRRDCPSTTKVVQERRIPFYTYGDNRYQARYPPPKRKANSMYAAIKASKRASTKKGKEDILAIVGLTGESCIWRLYELYGFDVSKDLVYDVMHVLALNLFKKYTKALFEGTSNHEKKLIDVATHEATLAVPKSFRHEGRWPSSSPSKHYTMFTAEEHQKFVMWCVPHVLNVVTTIKKDMKDIGMLLVDIGHIFYNHTRTHGWSKEDMEVTRALLSSWRILTEESQGASASPLEHVAGNAEMLDDILRHGGHDCMWCYKYERCVSGYIAIPTNNKANEVTYAKYQSRVLLTKTLLNMKVEEDGLLPVERLLLSLHACLQIPEGALFNRPINSSCEEWHKQGVMVATSGDLASNIFKVCELLDSCPCKDLVKAKGVLVSPQKRSVRPITDCERDHLQSFWRNHLIIDEVVLYAKVHLQGDRYCLQDRVIVCYSQEQFAASGHGLCEIKEFFSHQHCGNIEVFFVGSFVDTGFAMDGLPTNEVTGMRVVSNMQLSNTCTRILPISCIMHKCFLLPTGGNGDCVIYEMQDVEVRKRLLKPGLPGCVPPWVEIGDVVLVSINNCPSALQHAVVRGVCRELRRVRLGILHPLVSGDWVVDTADDTWRDLRVCLQLVPGWIQVAVVNACDGNREQQGGIQYRQIDSGHCDTRHHHG